MINIPQPRCPFCLSGAHSNLQCPRVKAVEFFPNSDLEIHRVEFYSTADMEVLLARVEELITQIKQSQAELAALKKIMEPPA